MSKNDSEKLKSLYETGEFNQAHLQQESLPATKRNRKTLFSISVNPPEQKSHQKLDNQGKKSQEKTGTKNHSKKSTADKTSQKRREPDKDPFINKNNRISRSPRLRDWQALDEGFTHLSSRLHNSVNLGLKNKFLSESEAQINYPYSNSDPMPARKIEKTRNFSFADFEGPRNNKTRKPSFCKLATKDDHFEATPEAANRFTPSFGNISSSGFREGENGLAARKEGKRDWPGSIVSFGANSRLIRPVESYISITNSRSSFVENKESSNFTISSLNSEEEELLYLARGESGKQVYYDSNRYKQQKQKNQQFLDVDYNFSLRVNQSHQTTSNGPYRIKIGKVETVNFENSSDANFDQGTPACPRRSHREPPSSRASVLKVDMELMDIDASMDQKIEYVLNYAHENKIGQISFEGLMALFKIKGTKATFGEFVEIRNLELELEAIFEFMKEVDSKDLH